MRRLLALLPTLLYAACGGTPPGGACGADADCSGGSVCVDKTCVQTCNSARPCPDGEVCSDGLCRTANSCGAQSCGAEQECVQGACRDRACDGTICPVGSVCEGGICVETSCIGVVCPAGTRCAGGLCLADNCQGTPCPAGQVCEAGSCVVAACAGKTCTSGEVCANGTCYGTACGAMSCGAGQVCDNNVCVDALCAGVSCLAGGVCVQGTCRFPGCGSAQCNAGFVCTASGQCKTPSCAGVACPQGQQCNGGQCFPTSCPTGPCPPGEVCDTGACVPLDCAGVRCPGGEACSAGGVCRPTSCNGAACPGIFVCDMGSCVDPRCPGVQCPSSTVCSGGTCWPLGPPGGPPCASGQAFVRAACRELVCEGVVCPAGESCQGGSCYPGAGVFPAGWVYAGGSGAATGVVAWRDKGQWKKLNQTVLPPVKQLMLSPDGQTFYAVGNEGSFWFSTDGANWQQRWQGTATVTGFLESMEVDRSTGTLYACTLGESTNDLGKVVVSNDRGNSWTYFLQPPLGSFSSRSQPRNISLSPRPGRFYYSYNDSYFWSHRAVAVSEGGSQAELYSYGNLNPLMLVRAHPVNADRAFLLNGTLIDTADGGVKGAFNTCPNCIEFKLGNAATILASSGVQVMKSTNDAESWGARTVGIPAAASLGGMAQDRSGAFYVGNSAGGQAALLGSVDDGETWQTLNGGMERASGLHDPFPAWAPDAAYTTNSRVEPTVPNGYYYRATVNGSSGAVEPGFPLDAGAVVNDGTTAWRIEAQPSAMRVPTIAARSCPLGEVLCGVGCARTFDDREHCGSCSVVCAPGVGCYAGQCLGAVQGADAGVGDAGYTGPEIGCADGTREGFFDVQKYPQLAACSGSWTGELQSSSSAGTLCGAGWHVCAHGDPQLPLVSYLEAVAFPGCFAYRASNDFADGCEALDCTAGKDDVAGVGGGCGLNSGVSVSPSAVPAASAGGCLLDKGIIDSQCCSISDVAKMAPRAPGCIQRGETGVTCCKD